MKDMWRERGTPLPQPSPPGMCLARKRQSLPLSVRNKRGEGWEEGYPTADTRAHLQARWPSSPQPSPPSTGGEGEETGALNTYPPVGERVPEGRARGPLWFIGREHLQNIDV